MACFFLFPYFVSLVVHSLLLLLVPSNSHAIINHNNNNDGFSISLVHRDSPQSPFYNHSMTAYERRAAAARRSVSRQHYLMSLSSSSSSAIAGTTADISTKILPNSGEYIATIYIGIPPTKVTAIVDTATELNWVKGPPVYDPTKSTSYEQLKCFGPCPSSVSTCDNTSNLCTFNMTYTDRSLSSGIISYESFGFDDPKSGSGNMVGVASLMFGYATKTQDFEDPLNGILGLNRDPQSLISQLNIKRFSHCFTPKDDTLGSRMYFGSQAVIVDNRITIDSRKSNAYYVTMNGISVGQNLVQLPPGIFQLDGTTGEGGVVLDAATTYTAIRKEAYDPFKEEILRQINRTFLEGSDVCFKGTYEEMDDLPDVTFHFARLDHRLAKVDVYTEASEGVLCINIFPSDFQLSSIGNIHMRNVWIGYDLDAMGISFSPADCTNVTYF